MNSSWLGPGEDATTVLQLGLAFRDKFNQALDEDFNTAQAIGHLFELARAVNRLGNNKKAKKRAGNVVKPALDAFNLVASATGLMAQPTPEFLDEVRTKRLAATGLAREDIERLIVDQSIADEFVRRFVDKTRTLPLGDPRKPDPVVLGSVIGMATVEHCNALIDDALAKGGRLLCGGKATSTLMAATLIDRVTPQMRLYHEETFGPLKCIVRVRSVEEAIACANDSEYGLSAAVFGRDIARALNVARKIDSGICHVNASTVHDEAQMPFGGVKGSGYGRFGGSAGVAEFTDLRWLTVQTRPRQYPF